MNAPFAEKDALREAAAIGWDAAVDALKYEDGTPVEVVAMVNPYRVAPCEHDTLGCGWREPHDAHTKAGDGRPCCGWPPQCRVTPPGVPMPDAEKDAGCECPPCPGRGNDGHRMTHCAECCFGSGVEADIDCPTHGLVSVTSPAKPEVSS